MYSIIIFIYIIKYYGEILTQVMTHFPILLTIPINSHSINYQIIKILYIIK